VLGAGHRQHADVGRAFQQVHGVQVHPVDHVHLAGDQRVLARRRVDDRQHEHPSKCARFSSSSSGLRVITRLDAGLEAVEDVAAAAVARGRIDPPVRAGFDRQVIVDMMNGKSALPAASVKITFAVDLDVGDRLRRSASRPR
jgi:hypothetical protein